ncbi:hypothetical protein E2562_033322 [Oryza meyeriana var. granulata]|uniref:Uncharacterized protein n=1 Tax=Oryza meyeriana var. granulata TaxID=110450 RepID=A0A6G1E5Y1_9ORYZ|nr:hypothetical protein E2562_033322 [Oryza meyeriana var. granulata]
MDVAAMSSRVGLDGCSGHATTVGGLGCFNCQWWGTRDERNEMSRSTLDGCSEGVPVGRCGRLGGAGKERGQVEAERRLGRGHAKDRDEGEVVTFIAVSRIAIVADSAPVFSSSVL